MSSVKQVLIVGGTHGNEMTGIRLVENWLRNSDALRRPSLHIDLLLANPDAIRVCRRYVQSDLNRAFRLDLLDATIPAINAEVERAREINQLFGPKGTDSRTDLCIDIHNSTANMGISLIVNRLDDCMKAVLKSLQKANPSCKIIYQPEAESQLSYLPSLASRDLTIEVGPQAHGTLQASLFKQTESVVLSVLDALEEWNRNPVLTEKEEVTFFIQEGTVDYPRDASGNVTAMIHPALEGRDYQEVKPKDPIFLGFDGSTYYLETKESLWPCFIGEAAYLEKRIAFSTLQLKKELW